MSKEASYTRSRCDTRGTVSTVPSRRTQWLLTALCTALLTGCSDSVAGTPTAQLADPPYRDATVNDLPALLLEPADLDAILGATAMAVSDTAERALALDPGQTVTGDAGCLGAAFSAMANVYHHSGYLAAVGQRVSERRGTAANVAFQFVALYPDQAAAERFRAQAETAWQGCAGKLVSVKQSDTVTDTWTIGAATVRNGMVSVLNVQELGDGWACSRSLNARANVVVDVAACGESATADTSATIVTAIVGKLPS